MKNDQEVIEFDESKEVTYILRGSGKKDKFTGTREFLTDVIIQLGLPYRWSDSAQNFVDIKDLHDIHLVNCIKEEFFMANSTEDIFAAINHPLMAEFFSRHGDDTGTTED